MIRSFVFFTRKKNPTLIIVCAVVQSTSEGIPFYKCARYCVMGRSLTLLHPRVPFDCNTLDDGKTTRQALNSIPSHQVDG